MGKLTPRQVEVLVAKAFCLEVIADKADCTTRYHDLPDRPLEDFILAGLNVAPVFGDFAAARLQRSKSVFSHYIKALKVTNIHKSAKYINLGLLEIMFQVVAARLATNDPKRVVETMVKQLKLAPKSDVTAMLAARKLAWSTSKKPDKHAFEFKKQISTAKSPAEFYDNVAKFGETGTSSEQWVSQFHADWPLLRQMFEGLQKSKAKSLESKITTVFNPIRYDNPEIRIGILADMCAAAIFLHLSF